VCDDLYKNKYFDKDKTIYDNRKKTTSFYTNVLIIDDVNNPTNNGKVFLFKFGVKIMDKIDDIIEEGKQEFFDFKRNRDVMKRLGEALTRQTRAIMSYELKESMLLDSLKVYLTMTSRQITQY
jgi:hypothetical protein